jgi:hypothetical protein
MTREVTVEKHWDSSLVKSVLHLLLLKYKTVMHVLQAYFLTDFLHDKLQVIITEVASCKEEKGCKIKKNK